MKRKLSLLLALVMILSLVPMTAFAAPGDSPSEPAEKAHYSAAASYVSMNSTSDSVNEDLEGYLIMRRTDGTVMSNVYFAAGAVYVKSNRDAETLTIDADASGTFTTGDPQISGSAMANKNYASVPAFKTDAHGRVLFKVTSGVAGKVELAFYNDSESDGGILIGKTELTFNASTVNVSSITLTAPASKDAGKEIKLVAVVKDTNGNGIQDRTVVFEARKGSGSFAKIGEAKTNAIGEAELKVTYTSAGTYTFRARTGDLTTAVNPQTTVNALGPVAIEVSTKDTVVAKGNNDFGFIVKDHFGNEITTGTPVEITVESKPSGVGSFTVATPSYNSTEKDFRTTLNLIKVGEYKIRGTIAGTGIYQEITVQAKEYGTTQKIEAKLPSKKSLRAGLSTPDSLILVVNEVDENGIKKAAVNSDYVVSTSDITIASIDSSNNFMIRATSDDKKTGVVTITLRHKAKDLVATVDVPVVGIPTAIKATPVVTEGKAEVTLQYVDANGNVSYDATNTSYEVFKPEAVKVTSQGSFGTSSGKATLKLEGPVGTHKITVVSANGLATTFDVTFVGAPVVKPVIGAKSLVLNIGSTVGVADGAVKTMDVAPFIRDGRTFVPVRFIAEQLGAEVSFTQNAQGLTETVTLTRPDKTVTMTIGSTTITVVKDGKTTTVTSDVAPFIESGRTVLPFRALAEAMGATVNYGMNADNTGVAWVSFEQK